MDTPRSSIISGIATPQIAELGAKSAKVGWPFRAHTTIIDVIVMTEFPELPEYRIR